MQFLRDHLGRGEVFGRDVLEVGSQDVNGSPRTVICPLGPRTYYGVDFCDGKGVDVVLPVDDLVSRFGHASFDLVVSTEMLEHAKDWRTAVRQMKQALKPGGFLVISTRGPGFPYHGHPHDYWRYTVADFHAIFSDMKILVCKEDASPGVLFKAFKYPNVPETDLSAISVERIYPFSRSVEGGVDLLVANWNTLPWLRLLVSQVRRFQPEIKTSLFVWDNASTDGSVEWLKSEGIPHHASPVAKGHADSLSLAMGMTGAPYVCFMDVDSVPIADGWLDEAVLVLCREMAGAVGLKSGNPLPLHRPFVHPSFCVFRRELYQNLGATPYIVHDEARKADFDVGEMMCVKMEEAEYPLKFVGDTHLDLAQQKSWRNKVVHCLSSTPVLCEKRTDLPFVNMVNGVVRWHRLLLGKLGLWQEFEGYARDTVSKNIRCGLYVDQRSVPPGEIRLSIVIPTTGRESLRKTLLSIEAGGVQAQDEVIVVGDGPQPRAEEICREFSARMKVRFQASRETRQFGAHQRNLGMAMATGTHVLFIDDDDCYKPEGLKTVRAALSQAPDRLHLFRIEAMSDRHPFKVLWSDPNFRIGNVGTQMIALPIVEGLLGIWPNSHCADYGFLSDTIPRFGLDRIIWREEIIAELH